MQVGMTSPACCALNGYLYITGKMKKMENVDIELARYSFRWSGIGRRRCRRSSHAI